MTQNHTGSGHLLPFPWPGLLFHYPANSALLRTPWIIQPLSFYGMILSTPEVKIRLLSASESKLRYLFSLFHRLGNALQSYL